MADVQALQPRELLATLDRAKVEFVVIGGFALAPHGYIRATKDLDIVPRPSAANRRRLATALAEIDAAVAIGDVSEEELGLRPDERGLAAGGNWVLHTRHGRLDVMQDVPGLGDYAQLRAGAVVVDGVHYAGYDDLIRMKLASGRDEDLRDVGALEAARSGR
jgi:hypothetical protein